ncbi:transposase, partial [Thermodesulfobacteriota bacterium]
VMPRIPRLLIPDEPTIYHVMSRTALAGLPMGEVEKEYLVRLMQQFSRLYFAEIIGFCCRDNHFHLLVRMQPQEQFSDEQIRLRHECFFGEKKRFSAGQLPYYRQKYSSLSEFIKELKQSFSRWYNKLNDRRGFFWSERFKSVIVENGETLINCLAYIDLNPVRAGIVQTPEQYRWSSLGYLVQGCNRDGFVSLDFGMREFGDMEDSERLRQYRQYVYETGAVAAGKGACIDPQVVSQQRHKGYQLSRAERFLYRSRYFTDSAVIGSRQFLQEQFQRFRKLLQAKTEREPKRVSGLAGVYSMKRLGA